MERTKIQGVYTRQSENRRNFRDGKIDACFYITYNIDGKKKWEKIGWKSEGYTAQYAQGIRAERMQSIRHGEEAIKPKAKKSDQTMTFGDAWNIYSEKWLPNLSRPDNDKSRYDRHVASRFADIPLDQIRPLDLEDFKQELLTKKKLAPATAKHVLCLIRCVYNKLAEWELYEGRNPTANFKMPKVDNARVRYLTEDEADRLLADVKRRSLFWWRLSCVSLYSGLRLGEVLGLIWGDIDLASGSIHVRDAKSGTRMAKINAVVKAIFEDMPRSHPSALLFPSREGKLLTETSVPSKTFARAVKAVKLNDNVTDERQRVVFHTLRHTFASWLAIDGVPLYTISKLMGHSSLEMTMRYAHLCPDVKRDAVALLEKRAIPSSQVS
jgi:integrase